MTSTSPRPAQGPAERVLEQLQKKVTEGQLARDRLTEQAWMLWVDHNMTQQEIASRLDRADRAAGGEGVTYAAVQKMFQRKRQQVNAELGLT